MRFSLVIPVYKNADGLPRLLDAIAELDRDSQAQHGVPLDAVFIVDGSPDDSYARLVERLPSQTFASRLALHSRNFGAFAAIRTGLELADGDGFGVMAADLQEPPELILEFIELLASDAADVVVGVRTKRDDPLLGRVLSRIFWGFYRRTVIRDMPQGGVDIFGCNRAFRDNLLRFGEARSSLVAQVFWLGFRRREVPYKREKRQQGRSAWSLRKRLDYMSDSIFAFTDLPIKLLTHAGVIGVVLSVAISVFLVLARLFGAIDVPGYTPLMLATIFFGSLNLIAFGVVGNYAWRAYTNTQARPLAVVARVDRFDGRGALGDKAGP